MNPAGQRQWRRWTREIRPTLALAAPVATGMLSQALLGLADTRMVAPLGVVPLGACAFVNNIVHPPLIFSIGLLTAVSVEVSNGFGARDREFVGESLRHGLLMAGLAGAGVLACACLMGWFLPVFGQPEDVTAASHTYLILFAASFVPGLLAHTGKLHGEALDHPWAPNLILLGGVGLNILLNWILIYGNWGAPKLGLEGAGWATLIARTLSAVAMIGYTIRAPSLAPWHPRAWIAPIQRTALTRMWRLGWPAALHHLAEVAAFVLVGLMMGWLGKEALAAHQVAMQCVATTFMITLGLAVAVSVRVGHANGAGQPRRVRRIGVIGLVMASALMGSAALVLILHRHGIADWFVDAPRLIELTATLLGIAAWFQIADGVQVMSGNALRGIRDVRAPALIALCCFWGVQVPLAAILGFHLEMGPIGVWWGLAAGLTLAAIWLTVRFFRLSRPSCPAEPARSRPTAV